ncbi:MAG: AMP-binding protein [Parabacteroides sp.]|nr:AMP-binding protein [Parabacteroides sp.]
MFRFDIQKQTLTLKGVTYSYSELRKIGCHRAAPQSPFEQDLFGFLAEWFSPSPEITVHTSGSTGEPKPIVVRKEQMMRSAEMTCSVLQLRENDTALLCLPLSYIAGKMVVVRALIAGLDLYPVTPSGHPLAGCDVPFRFAAMIPLQVYNSLQAADEKEKLKRIERLIIGGGAVDASLQNELKDFPNPVYSTYGMTETLSHIALQQLNGADGDNRYRPLPKVTVSLSDEGTLTVEAPLVNDCKLVTNDVARIYPDGSFEILGRKDNIINTGGVKVQAEEVESRLRAFIDVPFAVASQPHPKFGEIVVLLIEGNAELPGLKERMEACLMPYQVPKKTGRVNKLPLTASGKINRAAVKQLALTL